MTLTKKQLKIAVEMYGLAIVYNTDGQADTEEECELQGAVSHDAGCKWLKKFPNLEMPTHISECIQLAKKYY